MQKLDPKKVPGSKDITLEDGTIVSIRRPKVVDQLGVSHINNAGEREVTLIANLTMKTFDEIKELWSSDYALLRDQLESFLSPKKES
ncbi:MAG: phage tail assembly protein [Campylobacterales bacterium]|nr:phage tail assembly protein [Campylobacterales bacterium]